jgi:hypothetical protein
MAACGGDFGLGFERLGHLGWLAAMWWGQGDSVVVDHSMERAWVWHSVTPGFEGKPNANNVRARISYSRTQQLYNMDIITQCSK